MLVAEGILPTHVGIMAYSACSVERSVLE